MNRPPVLDSPPFRGSLAPVRREGIRPTVLFLAAFLVLAAILPACADLTFDPTWQFPSPAEVRAQVIGVLEASEATAEQREQAAGKWSETDLAADRLLDLAIESLALGDEQLAKLVKLCSQPYDGALLPKMSWLYDDDRSEFIRHNAQLYYARWLAQNRLYDEAIKTSAELTVKNVVDPAALLFYRLVAYQQVVQPEKSRAALVTLLEREDAIPRRYQQIARLVQRDLAALDDESLGHVARRMGDVGRRLSMGRAGDQVQIIEKGVLDDLEKMIEEEEERQKQQQQQSASNPNQSSKPMEDSRPAELKAPGKVDPKDIGHKSGWGDLPPKERQQALQQIGRDFPAHYREVIEQYFRELAAEPDGAQP